MAGTPPTGDAAPGAGASAGARLPMQALWAWLCAMVTYPGFILVGPRSDAAGENQAGLARLNDALVDEKVTIERVRVFADRAFQGALGSPLGTIIVAWIGVAAAGWRRALAWAAVFTVVQFCIGVAGARYRRGASGLAQALAQGRTLILLSAAAGLCWGSSVWVFWAEGQFESYLVIHLVLVGVAGLSLLNMAYFLSATALFFGGVVLVPALHAFTLASPLAFKLAIGLSALYLMLLHYGGVVGMHLVGDVESKIRSGLLAERLRLALGAARQDWFDLDLESGELLASSMYTHAADRQMQSAKDGLHKWLDMVHAEDRKAVTSALRRARSTDDAVEVEYRIADAQGRWAWIRAIGRVARRTAQGRASRIIGVHLDVTDRKSIEEQIRRLAFYDALTDLPNRRLLGERLHHAIARTVRRSSTGALMLLDMDDFKTLNDTHGHAMGDLLLCEVARRLKSCVREVDMVARLGGDEFVVVLEDLDGGPRAAEEAGLVAQKILNAVRTPYQLNLTPESGATLNYTYHCSTSIGVVLFAGRASTAEELLKRADTAMYEAKAMGRDTVRFFDPLMQEQVSERAAIANGLRDAVREGQFTLYYQPLVDGAGSTIGCEVLLRWLHPTRGVVTPDKFIQVAETSGLILPMGRWVLESACAQLVKWARQPETAHLTIAVNVSTAQFRDEGFVEHVFKTLESTGADPAKLKIEITESLLMSDVDAAIAKMSKLTARGVGFALDDFGTGYSSLAYLKRLPIEHVKIDKSFVRDVLVDANDAVIVRTIIALADSLGLVTVAEGVETAEQHDFLRSCGCTLYQGYHFGRPMPIDALEHRLLPERAFA